MKSRTLVATVVALCVFGAGTTVASAATMHKAKKPAPAPAVTLTSSPPSSLMCGKGSTPTLHTMGKLHWSCTKVA